jgi:hypothetical protein
VRPASPVATVNVNVAPSAKRWKHLFNLNVNVAPSAKRWKPLYNVR